MRWMVLVAALAAPMPAHSENLSGNELLRVCTAEGVTELAAFCIGYTIGTVEGMRYGVSVPVMLVGEASAAELNTMGDATLMYCPPIDVENGQYIDIVTKYLRNNPEQRHGSARMLIHFALIQAFPCAKQ